MKDEVGGKYRTHARAMHTQFGVEQPEGKKPVGIPGNNGIPKRREIAGIS
jgi:hypothetical protein